MNLRILHVLIADDIMASLMDKTDVILSMLLLANPQTPYRELTDKLYLSADAIYKRIQSLVELGVIHKLVRALPPK